MARIIFFLIFLAIIVYPIFEVNSKKVNLKKKVVKNVSDLIIKDGDFFIYKKELASYGRFYTLKHNKKGYVFFDFFYRDILKKESIFAKKVFYNKNVRFYYFFYSNNEYNFTSKSALYLTENKSFKGKNFLITSTNFVGSGKDFFMDKDRNIKADYISYYLKVKK